MPVIVQKYGGTSVGTPERIEAVADRIVRTREDGNDVLVVVSAMAVLRRPEVFHAAIAGAPVTDWRLYETYYTEWFLGLPDEEPEVYDRNSLVADAPNLVRPLLLIHGLADDNVFVAHTIKLSEALFDAGRPHELVLIPDATHLTRTTAVTENLLRVQLDFLKRTLGVA